MEMSPFIKYILIFLLGVATHWGFTKWQNSNTVSVITEKDTASNGLAVPNQPSTPDVKLTNPILYDSASQYIINYQNLVNNTDIKKPVQTQYFWLSINEMDSLLNKFKGAQIRATGIRIYPAVYPRKKFLKPRSGGVHRPTRDNELDVSSKLTLIFVPTQNKEVEPWGPMPFDIISQINAKDSSLFFIPGEVNLENETTLCPPPNNCIGYGATLLEDQYRNGRLKKPRTDNNGTIKP